MYQDLGTCHDWPVKKSIVNLPIRFKGNTQRIPCSNSLNPLETQNKDTRAEFCIGDLLREEVAKEVRLYLINAK